MLNINHIIKIAIIGVFSVSINSAQADQQPAEVFVPVYNPITGLIEYKRCHDFPECDDHILAPEHVEEVEND